VSASNGNTLNPTVVTVPVTLPVTITRNGKSSAITMLHGVSKKGNAWWNSKIDVTAPLEAEAINAKGEPEAVFDPKTLVSYELECLGVKLTPAAAGVHLSKPRESKTTGKPISGTGGNPTVSYSGTVEIGEQAHRVMVQLTYVGIVKKTGIHTMVISAKVMKQATPERKVVGSIEGDLFG
jgi:hypothetical protein